MLAAQSDHVGVCKDLIDRGASVNNQDHLQKYDNFADEIAVCFCCWVFFLGRGGGGGSPMLIFSCPNHMATSCFEVNYYELHFLCFYSKNLTQQQNIFTIVGSNGNNNNNKYEVFKGASSTMIMDSTIRHNTIQHKTTLSQASLYAYSMWNLILTSTNDTVH